MVFAVRASKYINIIRQIIRQINHFVLLLVLFVMKNNLQHRIILAHAISQFGRGQPQLIFRHGDEGVSADIPDT